CPRDRRWRRSRRRRGTRARAAPTRPQGPRTRRRRREAVRVPGRERDRASMNPPGGRAKSTAIARRCYIAGPFPTREASRRMHEPELSSVVPRELALELLGLARASGAGFADLYAEHAVVSGFSLDEDRIKVASHTVLQGVGVRAILGEQTGYAYADGFAP